MGYVFECAAIVIAIVVQQPVQARFRFARLNGAASLSFQLAFFEQFLTFPRQILHGCYIGVSSFPECACVK